MSQEKQPIQLALLISGGGTTMEAIIRATKQGGSLYKKVEPVIVISSRPDARGIGKAESLGIPVKIVERKQFEKGPVGLDAFGKSILAHLQEYGAHHVSQNGWLPFTPTNVIEKYEGFIFNQHPGPLDPDHTGLDGKSMQFGGKGMHGLAVHAAVLEFQRLANRVFPDEATVHRVSPEVDGGTVMGRQEVDVCPGDTPEMLASRMLPLEHILQIGFWEQVYQGTATESHRSDPLIHAEEESFLHQAIVYARDAYPNG
jgi:phosphoribosylglycinamide formyltransferase 1